MIVIVGLVVLLVAAIVGFTGVLTNAGPDHLSTENFLPMTNTRNGHD
jgi:hypothetical protein